MTRTFRTVAGATLSLMLAAFGMLFVNAGAAQAAPDSCYPIDSADCPADLALSDATVPQGGTVTVTATGLDPGTSASGEVRSRPISAGTQIVGPAGSATFSVDLPENFPTGQHRFIVRGTADGTVITMVTFFTVVDDAAGSGAGDDGADAGGLPATGSEDNLAPLAGLGVALLAAGGLVLYVGRRRTQLAA